MRSPLVAILCFHVLAGAAAAQTTVSGLVVDEAGAPLAGAQVRIGVVPAGSNPVSGKDTAVTGADGSYSVDVDAKAGQTLYVGTGRSGTINVTGMVAAKATATPVGTTKLLSVSPIDNEAYEWVKPYFPKTDVSDFGCNMCHGKYYDEWKGSRMAQSANDPYVLSLYMGWDSDGAPAGDGYRKDFPNDPGPCTNCHAPAAALSAPGQVAYTDVTGVAKEGVFCDVCHKVKDVVPGAGPGVAGSLVYARPSAWTGLFAFGPFVDAFSMPMKTSYNATLTTSRFCAGCHDWTNDFGVPVLSTFSEWSEMSGADPDALQCQDCHMKKKFGDGYKGEPAPTMEFLLDDPMQQQMHGVLRSSDTLRPHEMKGGEDYAKEAAGLAVDVAQEERELVVTVTVENVNAGHALPTGMPFRHMILVLDASIDGAPLELAEGGTVPDYGGEGSAPEDLAGKPGKGYARVLGDGKGGRNVPFWKATEVIEDTRIPGAESDEQTFRFALEEPGLATVSARLVYRRAFRAMNVEKKWAMPDILMREAGSELQVDEVPEATLEADTGPAEVDAGAGETADAAADVASGSAGPGEAKTEPGRGDGCATSPGSAVPPAGVVLLLALVALGRSGKKLSLRPLPLRAGSGPGDRCGISRICLGSPEPDPAPNRHRALATHFCRSVLGLRRRA